jgi:hypothetical protein
MSANILLERGNNIHLPVIEKEAQWRVPLAGQTGWAERTMTIPVKDGLGSDRLPASGHIGSPWGRLWRHISHRAFAYLDAFLRDTLPPPAMVFPDSGNPLTQFPTLSAMEVHCSDDYPQVWDEPSPARALLARRARRLRPMADASPMIAGPARATGGMADGR